MSNYHKPRTFRSLNGCCICRAKSSSSRFTDSEKYESDFYSCFGISEERAGEICNACVLLVKRWKKLPRGSKKNWSHVVDARAGPGGGKVTLKPKRPLKDDPDVTNFKKIATRQTSTYSETPDSEKSQFAPSPSPSDQSETSSGDSSESHDGINSLLDLSYWKRQEVCCGVVWVGKSNELMLDHSSYKPCSNHKKRTGPRETSRGSTAAESDLSSRCRTDTFSSHSSLGAVDSPMIGADKN